MILMMNVQMFADNGMSNNTEYDKSILQQKFMSINTECFNNSVIIYITIYILGGLTWIIIILKYVQHYVPTIFTEKFYVGKKRKFYVYDKANNKNIFYNFKEYCL